MTRKHLIAVAKQEIREWHVMPRGIVLAILFAYIHRLTTGETVEETFFPNKTKPAQPDYEI